MARVFHTPKANQKPQVHSLISKIKNPNKRNLLRGHSSKSRLSANEIEDIRKNNTLDDLKTIGAILKGPHNLLNEERKKKSADLYNIITTSPLEWKKEICYTAGYINSTIRDALDALDHIRALSRIDSMSLEDALENLLILAKKYGASNYLSYKLAYIRSSREIPPTSLSTVTQIEDEIFHKDSPGMHFSALENVSPKISLFQVAQRRASASVGKVDGDIRKTIALSNFVPTPLSENDCAGFLLRASESCLVDTVYAIITIFNLNDRLSAAQKELEKNLCSEFIEKLLSTTNSIKNNHPENIITEHYRSQNEEGLPTLDLYRASAAFLEHPKYALYRSDIDRVIGARLLAEISDVDISKISPPLDDKKLLLAPDETAINEHLPIRMDTFHRTYLFLKFINNHLNIISLTKDDIKYIFENTIELEMLLSEEEMRALHLTAPHETKSLVAVLALALFRKKSVDPDIDFEFRSDFIWHVNNKHNGSIVDFINNLLDDSPQIAGYIVRSLDEVTLEKMYSLVKNASQASEIRCEILRTVGQKLNKIEYIIEADGITTRSKVAKLQQYFDSSRMYVDSVSMKKWLDSNPTVSTEQYRSLFPSIEARNESGFIVLHISDQSEYLISQIAKDAFEQFCLNTEFGIQSYLGRRIRHNTLDGVTTDTVDAVLRKHEFQSITSTPTMRRTIESWLNTYKSIIDKLRRDHLQFKSAGSLFNANLDLDESTTKENIRKLTSTLKTTGTSELLNDLIIAFCWKQITPQLDNAARFIKTTLLKEANASIDKSFSSNGLTEGQMKAELHEAVNEVFRKVADWFQVPQTGFISASARDLCEIILIELNRQNCVDFIGDAVNTKYTGISVHRLYDCLAVLLQNAHKHGEDNTRIRVEACINNKEPGAILDIVSISIKSIVSEGKYTESKDRILSAIASKEAGTDMVTEGYTGIKKVKFITRTCESTHTVHCNFDDETRELDLGFRMHMETVTEDPAGGDE